MPDSILFDMVISIFVVIGIAYTAYIFYSVLLMQRFMPKSDCIKFIIEVEDNLKDVRKILFKASEIKNDYFKNMKIILLDCGDYEENRICIKKTAEEFGVYYSQGFSD